MKVNQTMIDELRGCVRGEVLDDDYSLGMYSTDASFYQIRPIAVILPKDESDVRKAVGLARKNKIKILPRGGGTSLAGQTVGEALVIDFSKHMNQVLDFNAEERWVKVQPGVVRDELNEQIDWDTRIYEEREQSLRYVCETPVLLEQRLFQIGRHVSQLVSQN